MPSLSLVEAPTAKTGSVRRHYQLFDLVLSEPSYIFESTVIVHPS